MAQVFLDYKGDEAVVIEEQPENKNRDGDIYQRCRWKNYKQIHKNFKEWFGMDFKFIDSIYNIYKIEPSELVFDMYARLGCASCGKWRRSWMCPPYAPTLEACRATITSYKTCLLIVYKNDGRQSWKHAENEVKPHFYCRKQDRGLKGVGFGMQHAIDNVAFELRDLFRKNGHKEVKGFLSGKCSLCWQHCAIEETDPKTGKPMPCIHPDKVMPSPEAWGIDMYGTFNKFGIKYEHPIRNVMTFSHMMLLDKK